MTKKVLSTKLLTNSSLLSLSRLLTMGGPCEDDYCWYDGCMDNPEEEKIVTLNLDGKKGVNILKSRYVMMKDAILETLRSNGQTTLTELSSLVESDLGKKFDGKIGWYLMAVKLDLEARGTIVRVPNRTPQTLTLK